MLWFLRLFSTFRELESTGRDIVSLREAVADLTTEKLLLQDRLDSALADKDHLWSVMQEALDGERTALRMQVNHYVQRSGGGTPYPTAHSLPPNATVQVQAPGPVGRRGRQLPSEAAAQATNRALQEFLHSREIDG